MRLQKREGMCAPRSCAGCALQISRGFPLHVLTLHERLAGEFKDHSGWLGRAVQASDILEGGVL